MCYTVENYVECPLCRRHLDQVFTREKCAQMVAAGSRGVFGGCRRAVESVARGHIQDRPCHRCPGFAQMYDNRSRVAARQERLREEHWMSTWTRDQEYRRRRREAERARRRRGGG